MAIFKGAGVAIVTPMKENEEVNYDKLEEIINQQPLILESLVVGRKNGLVALIVLNPDAVKAAGISNEEAGKIVEEGVFAMNNQLPIYSRIAKCEVRDMPFEKTPKLSIKRFMYQ